MEVGTINRNLLIKSIGIENRLLKERIIRMCATDNRAELYQEYSSAKKSIDDLYDYNLRRIDA